MNISNKLENKPAQNYQIQKFFLQKYSQSQKQQIRIDQQIDENIQQKTISIKSEFPHKTMGEKSASQKNKLNLKANNQQKSTQNPNQKPPSQVDFSDDNLSQIQKFLYDNYEGKTLGQLYEEKQPVMKIKQKQQFLEYAKLFDARKYFQMKQGQNLEQDIQQLFPCQEVMETNKVSIQQGNASQKQFTKEDFTQQQYKCTQDTVGSVNQFVRQETDLQNTNLTFQQNQLSLTTQQANFFNSLNTKANENNNTNSNHNISINNNNYINKNNNNTNSHRYQKSNNINNCKTTVNTEIHIPTLENSSENFYLTQEINNKQNKNGSNQQCKIQPFDKLRGYKTQSSQNLLTKLNKTQLFQMKPLDASISDNQITSTVETMENSEQQIQYQQYQMMPQKSKIEIQQMQSKTLSPLGHSFSNKTESTSDNKYKKSSQQKQQHLEQKDIQVQPFQQQQENPQSQVYQQQQQQQQYQQEEEGRKQKLNRQRQKSMVLKYKEARQKKKNYFQSYQILDSSSTQSLQQQQQNNNVEISLCKNKSNGMNSSCGTKSNQQKSQNKTINLKQENGYQIKHSKTQSEVQFNLQKKLIQQKRMERQLSQSINHHHNLSVNNYVKTEQNEPKHSQQDLQQQVRNKTPNQTLQKQAKVTSINMNVNMITQEPKKQKYHHKKQKSDISFLKTHDYFQIHNQKPQSSQKKNEVISELIQSSKQNYLKLNNTQTQNQKSHKTLKENKENTRDTSQNNNNNSKTYSIQQLMKNMQKQTFQQKQQNQGQQQCQSRQTSEKKLNVDKKYSNILQEMKVLNKKYTHGHSHSISLLQQHNGSVNGKYLIM